MGSRRRNHAMGVVVFASALFSGCGSTGSVRAAVPPRTSGRAPPCAVDEVREFFCDDLIAPNSTLPAPAPFEACPASMEGPVGQYDPAPVVASFDASYTEYTRRRAPPGHACCYSWCSPLHVADPSLPSIQTSCTTGRAFREEFCMIEPESGTSAPAGAPFERCPIAIVPPEKAVFSAPESAVLDPTLTSTRRAKGESDCCYAWCSQAPPGSGLHRR